MAGARDKVWFVTGCSTGMGRDIAIAALEQGYRAVLTARNPDALAEIHARFPQRSAVARLDVTDRAQIDAAVRCARGVRPDRRAREQRRLRLHLGDRGRRRG